MSAKNFTVVGLGEILWDLLPGGKQLGGAPANFAYMTSLLGDRGIVASRIGEDSLGREVLSRLANLSLSPEYVQLDRVHPTGTVEVQVDSAGQARYQFTANVAWDFLEWTPSWQRLARKADAVCFGSLAQRSPHARQTILAFLKATRPDAVRIFDVNLRQNFYSREILAESFQAASVAKLNHEELPRVMHLMGLSYDGDVTSAARLRDSQRLRLICITRGDNGCVLADESRTHAHPGFPVRVVDTIGSGDAFTAALVHHYLREASLEEMNEAANRLGAWVATNAGATPVPGPHGLEHALASLE